MGVLLIAVGIVIVGMIWVLNGWKEALKITIIGLSIATLIGLAFLLFIYQLAIHAKKSPLY